jgi:hypothetical protein
MSTAAKIMKFFLALGQVGLEVEQQIVAAEAAGSDGGKKITTTEIIPIVKAEFEPVIAAFAGLFA